MQVCQVCHKPKVSKWHLGDTTKIYEIPQNWRVITKSKLRGKVGKSGGNGEKRGKVGEMGKNGEKWGKWGKWGKIMI